MTYGSPHYSADRKSAALYANGISPMYKLDEATGLPEVLDEGAYFKVVRGGSDNCYFYIQYMIRRRWWFDKKLDERKESAWIREIKPNDILMAALRIIEYREHVLKLERDPEYRAEHKAKQRARDEDRKKEAKERALKQAEEKRLKVQRENQMLGKYPPKKLGE